MSTTIPAGSQSIGRLAPLVDSHGRVLRDLRVSVTDKCNFRCMYCLPETEEAANFYQKRFETASGPLPGIPRVYEWKPRTALLSFEEIERVVRLFVRMGIEKIRLTGGEPLLRNDLEELVGMINRIEGVQDLAMTTNGFLFGRKAEALKKAGLRRVSFSMDSLDAAVFKKMTGRDGLASVLEGIDQAIGMGMQPVKVNAVVIRGINEDQIVPLIEFARGKGISFRFIEFMPLDSGRSWLRELVVPGSEILARLKARYELRPIQSSNLSETARRWGFADSTAEVGIIAPVTEPFCGHCNRIRMTADGKIRTCLFSLKEPDLKGLLRGGASDVEIERWLREVVMGKEARHHIGEEGFVQPERTMSCIGG